MAVLFWVNDRVFCDVWTSISFPYLHCAWHILIFIASYTGCVLGSYFYAANEFPQLRPTVSYWPCWSPNLGLPYIVLKAMPREKPYETTEPVNYIPEKKCWAWSRQFKSCCFFLLSFFFFCLSSNVCLILYKGVTSFLKRRKKKISRMSPLLSPFSTIHAGEKRTTHSKHHHHTNKKPSNKQTSFLSNNGKLFCYGGYEIKEYKLWLFAIWHFSLNLFKYSCDQLKRKDSERNEQELLRTNSQYSTIL